MASGAWEPTLILVTFFWGRCFSHEEIWVYLQDVLLKKYGQHYNGINVQLGPAFDYNYDGLYDTPHQIKEYALRVNTQAHTDVRVYQ